MSVLVHLMSEFDHYSVRCEDDAPVIWVEGRRETVSFTFDRKYRESLRKALDRADALDQECSGTPVGEEDGS